MPSKRGETAGVVELDLPLGQFAAVDDPTGS